jgi:hypothetical protein
VPFGNDAVFTSSDLILDFVSDNGVSTTLGGAYNDFVATLDAEN